MNEHKHNKLDLKDVSADGEFEGYASVFGVVDQGNDQVEPGAFSKTLSGRAPSSVKMLFQHDPDQPIGVWQEFKEDSKGLWCKGKILSSVSRGAEVLELMRAGILDGLSVGFKTIKSTRDEQSGVRKLLEMELWEVSAVTFPMNALSTVTNVKNLMTVRDAEAILRDAGVPNSFAKNIASHGFEKAREMLSNKRRDDEVDNKELADMIGKATQLLKGNK